MNDRRAYSMRVRGEKAAATRQRIVESAQALFVDPSEEFTLERIASMAGVSVQTVLRAFGNKETLIVEAIGTFRPRETPVVIESPRSVEETVMRLFDDYEQIGDRVIRMLAEEHRIPGFAEAAAGGRAMHREWVESALADQLAGHPAGARRRIVLALLAATDVYVWKLLRRDLGLDRRAAESVVGHLIRGALASKQGE